MTGTTNLNLIDPTVGGDSDAWGGFLNSNFTTLDAMLAGVLYGLTLSAAGSTATFGVAAGATSGMTLSSAYTKTAGAWTLGSGNGALDTGVIANSTWYHVFLIQRSDTGVVDILISTSFASPTMPASYDRKRRIGSMKTDGSAQWVKFTQIGDDFIWSTAVQDFNGALTSSGVAQDLTLTVPPGLNVKARLRGEWGNGTANAILLVDSKSSGATVANSPTGNGTVASPGGGTFNWFVVDVLTDTSAKIKLICTDNGPTAVITTHGWIDRRGRD